MGHICHKASQLDLSDLGNWAQAAQQNAVSLGEGIASNTQQLQEHNDKLQSVQAEAAAQRQRVLEGSVAAVQHYPQSPKSGSARGGTNMHIPKSKKPIDPSSAGSKKPVPPTKPREPKKSAGKDPE